MRVKVKHDRHGDRLEMEIEMVIEMERERQRKRGRCLQVSTSHDTESMLRAEDNCGVGPTFRWGIEQRSLPLRNKHSY